MTSFPPDFLWGAATSAYQIEGSPLADGAGASNWHRFAHAPGRILDGSTGDVACDHYRRLEEDVALMKELGLRAYRFSISWSRILPEGTGRVNRPGLDFYARLTDRLLAEGIRPMATLYHWDHPAVLDDRGGWSNPSIVDWFTTYAQVVFEALGDRVPLWATINEPWVIVDAGYLHGVHPPGNRDLREAAAAAHNLLLAHGAAVRAYRSLCRGRIGIVVNLAPQDPATESPEDREAAARGDLTMNRLYLDPVLRGRYPPGIEELFAEAWPAVREPDFSLIRTPIDFVGVNYYTRDTVRDDPSRKPSRTRQVRRSGRLYTETGWEVYPEGLTRILCWVTDRYGRIPIYVTENGAAFADPPRVEGPIHDDPMRVAYYAEHLRAAGEALRRGVDLRGYFAWSLLDNFEWSSGFTKRFGLYHVDYETRKRTLKSSGAFYRSVVRTNGRILDEQS